MGKPGGAAAEVQRSGAFFGTLVAFCQARWKWILTVTCVTSVGAIYYAATHLSIDSDPDALFSARLAFRRHAAVVEGAFPALRRQLVIVIDGDSPAVAHRAVGLFVDRLARDGDFEGVYAPGGGKFFDRNGLLFLSVEELQELADRLAWAQPFLAELARDPSLPQLLSLLERSFDAADSAALSSREWAETLALIAAGFGSPTEAQSGPITWENWALGGGGLARSIRLVFAEPTLDFKNLEPTRAALDRIREIAAALDLDVEHGVRVRITGDLALAAEELGTLRSEAALLGAASFAWVTVVLVVGLGSVRLAIATLVTLAVGLAWTSGLAAATVGSLNLLSVCFAVLFIGLGIDFGIHFAIRTLTFLHDGQAPADALRSAAERTGPTLAACAATTALGFFAFLPTSYRGIAELGLIAGIGIFVSLAATLAVFPALASRIGFRGRAAPGAETAAAAPSLPHRSVGAALCAAALLLLVLALPTLHNLRFDPDPLNVRDPHSEAVRAFRELVAAGPVSPWTAELVEADLDRAAVRASRLEALPEVRRALTLDSFVPDAQAEKLDILSDIALFLGDIRPRPPTPVDPAKAQAALQSLTTTLDRWLKQSADEPITASVRALLASTRSVLTRFQLSPGDYRDVERLQTRLIGDLPEWLDRLHTALQASPVAREDLPAALRARFVTPNGRARVQVIAERDLSIPGEIERFVDAVSAEAPLASGSAVRIVESARAVTHALRQAFLYAVLAIALVLFALWRRGSEVLAALGVLALAALYTAASSVWLGVPLNFANVVALPLLLGIGVDTAIHMLAERRVQTRASTRATRRAVTLSALTTLGSFGVLGFSRHPGLASLGQLLALGLAWVLIVNLWVLPAFHAFAQSRRPRA